MPSHAAQTSSFSSLFSLTGETGRLVDIAGAVARDLRIRTQWSGAAGPRRQGTGIGRDTLGCDPPLDPIDDCGQRVELIGRRPAGAMVHARDRIDPDETVGVAVIRGLEPVPPVEGIVDRKDGVRAAVRHDELAATLAKARE